MKHKLFLVRHGESLGNVDKSVYDHTPDWKVGLTDKGVQQAKSARDALKISINQGSVTHFYTSPYIRTKQTLEIIREVFNEYSYTNKYEPRLREIESSPTGNWRDMIQIQKERVEFGPFFYRFPNGESGTQVYDRVSSFLMDFKKDVSSNTVGLIGENYIFVTHAFTIRILLMAMLRWDVDTFHKMKKPNNCEIFELEYDSEYDIFELKSKINMRE